MKQLTIKNCTLVNEGSLLERDVLIKNGRIEKIEASIDCLLYTSPSPRDGLLSRMPSSA